MISVIVPIYNVEKYVRNCVKSIQNQTYKDLEIILVDDGSPDHCGEICDQFAAQDERIVVIHQANAGLAGARNAGLEICRGEYVAFVDGDDTIDLMMYETMLFIAQKNQADVVICGCQRVRNTSEIKSTTRSLEDVNYSDLNNGKLWEEIFRKLNNSACNKLYRKNIIDGLRFPDSVLHGEDLLFNLQYLDKCKRGALIKVPFYHYYQREGSITKSEFNKNKLLEIYVKDQARELVMQYNSQYIPTAEKYCFRARMNVLRAIYAAHAEDEYREEETGCREYIKSNYHSIKEMLRLKEKVEYWMMQNSFSLYQKIIGRMV